MRLNYSDDEDFPGQFGIWQANCTRSLRGKAGQAALKRLEAALVAMPEKRLIHGRLVDRHGRVCALGALARAEGKLPEPSPHANEWDDDVDDTAEFGEKVLKFPRLVSWKVVAENDINNDTYEWATAEGPDQYPGRYQNQGIQIRVPLTAERRYENMLAWVRANLVEPPTFKGRLHHVSGGTGDD